MAKVRLFGSDELKDLELRCNEFLSNPSIIVIDCKFSTRVKNNTIYKFISILYQEADDLKFKEIKQYKEDGDSEV
jgi:hypothetical protein